MPDYNNFVQKNDSGIFAPFWHWMPTQLIQPGSHTLCLAVTSFYVLLFLLFIFLFSLSYLICTTIWSGNYFVCYVTIPMSFFLFQVLYNSDNSFEVVEFKDAHILCVYSISGRINGPGKHFKGILTNLIKWNNDYEVWSGGTASHDSLKKVHN